MGERRQQLIHIRPRTFQRLVLPLNNESNTATHPPTLRTETLIPHTSPSCASIICYAVNESISQQAGHTEQRVALVVELATKDKFHGWKMICC